MDARHTSDYQLLVSQPIIVWDSRSCSAMPHQNIYGDATTIWLAGNSAVHVAAPMVQWSTRLTLNQETPVRIRVGAANLILLLDLTCA